MRYGYTRVSTAKQDCSNQIDALKAAGCTTIFTERVSAKSTNNRTEFNRLMRALKPGDTVVVTKLDRLARVGICTTSSTTVCGFISFGETWCDTTADVGKLVLTIVGGIAELERKLIQARSEEGIQKARDQGKKFRRPSALDAGQKRKIADRYAAGETMAELAREYEVGEATIFRALRLEPIAEGEIEGPAREAALSIQVMTFVTGACAMRSESRRSAVKVIPRTID